jgi:hypothetical protein
MVARPPPPHPRPKQRISIKQKTFFALYDVNNHVK